MATEKKAADMDEKKRTATRFKLFNRRIQAEEMLTEELDHLLL